MSRRLKPYTTNQTTWKSIFSYDTTVPMNQRDYEWLMDEICKFLDDLKNFFEEGKYVEKMGSLLYYIGNNTREIWDGQQRYLTTLLLLIVLAKKYPILNQSIMRLITTDPLARLSDQKQKLQDEYKNKVNCSVDVKIPNVYCINCSDQTAITEIYNDLYESFYQFRDYNNDNTFKCSLCSTSCGRKEDFITHLKKQHSDVCKIYPPKDNKSNIFEAFNIITNYINKLNYCDDTIKNLYFFILDDIDIQLFESTDLHYVSIVFDLDNNRGKSVKSLDTNKNLILASIPFDKQHKCYDEWTDFKNMTDTIYKSDFGEKIINIAIQLLNLKILRVVKHDELFGIITKDKNPFEKLTEFFQIVKKIKCIYDNIKQDRFGRLITTSARVCITWEGFMYCLLPIFYIIGKIDKDLIKLIVKWYFRNINCRTRTFNNLTYSNELLKISNEVINNRDYNYYDDIRNLFKKNMDGTDTTSEKYIVHIKTTTIKHTTATYLLLFIETIKSNIAYPPLNFTIEHIVPQDDRSTLSDTSNIDKIGNLTLLEGKNAENGHKGNSSLKNKPYHLKINSYKKSDAKITNELVENYKSTFIESDILKRTDEFALFLNEHTTY
jgi:hypothetical protein